MLEMLISCVSVFLCVLMLQGIVGNDRYYQPGDITLGGLFTLHRTTEDGTCGDFNPIGHARVEAMIFAIDKINRNQSLLPNVTLGYDIRDYCEIPAKAMEHAYDFSRRNDLIAECKSTSLVLADNKKISKSKPTPIAAVIGPADSDSAVLVGGLLQVAGIPVISESATSNELSSPRYRNFFRTVPPNKEMASAVADIIQRFNWSYVAAVAMDDSFGRDAVRELESEAERSETFCLSFTEYIPRQEYTEKMNRAVNKVKSFPNIRVVVLWLFESYTRRFLKEAAAQKLFDRTWIFCYGFILNDDLHVELKEEDQRIIHGSLGIPQSPYFYSQEVATFLFKESTKSFTNDSVLWWKKFWQRERRINCTATLTLNQRKSCIEIVLRKVYSTNTPYVLDAIYAVAHALHDMKNCSESGCENPGEEIDPMELERYLRSVDFKGLTGRISFDQYGDPVTSYFDIANFQVSDTPETRIIKLVIGSWYKTRNKKLHLNVSKIRWNTITRNELLPKSFCHEDCPAGTFLLLAAPCCWECYKCPDGTISTGVNDLNCTACPPGKMPNEGRLKCLDLPEIAVKWSRLASVLVILFGTIGLALVAICSSILYKDRDTPLVKAANRELSSILMLTIVFSFLASILSLAKPTNLMCSLVHCWRSMVLVTFVSILIIKTMKILSAFQINVIAERFKKFILTSKSQTLIVIALISIPAVFLSLWIALDSPRQQRIIGWNDTGNRHLCVLVVSCSSLHVLCF